jgi:hypothetical protein
MREKRRIEIRAAMQITLVPDSSIASAPAGLTAAVEAAAAVYEQDFPGNYNINISYGWGTFDNTPSNELTNRSSGVYSLGGGTSTPVSYSKLESWLSGNADSSAQIAADATLPASSASFPGDANTFFVSFAEEKALGVFTGDSSPIDGSIGFNIGDASTPAAWEPAALTEIAHALGWNSIAGGGSLPDVSDLFRYSSPGQYGWTSGEPAYFSIDGGNTDLADFATSFDQTLFSDLPADDPIRLPFTSAATTLTAFDIEALSVIGFRAANAVSPPGGGGSDVLLQMSVTVADWIIQNGQYAGGNILSTAAAGWIVVATGDFTGNGTDDVLLQNGGTIVDWLLQNGQYSSGNVLTTSATGWDVVGTGDFTGNGTDDVLLQNGGTVVDWIVKNGAYESGNVLSTAAFGWTAVGTGDFTGSGTNDVLLQNGGTVVDWIMNDGVYQSGNVLTTGATGWKVVGTGDFTGNGTDDVLLQNGGTIVDWSMQNGKYVSGNVLSTNAAGFNVVGTGDYNGDGTSDILLQNGGTVVDWIMKNGEYSSGNILTTAAADWRVAHT